MYESPKLEVLNETVCFPSRGFGEEKAAEFSYGVACILASHTEGLPMAVLKVWSYGLPVLQTSACNLHERLEAEAAIRIEPEIHAAANGLQEIIDMSPQERHAMGQRGHALVEERSTCTDVAEQMHAVYRWVLSYDMRPDSIIIH